MRRSCLLGLTLFLLLGLLAACGEAPDKENPRLPASEACLTGRVAAVEGAQLLVASLEEGAGESDVYAVSLGQCPVAYQDPDQGAIRPGDRIQVGYGGTVEETFPARLGEVTGILVEASGFDDLCALYLQVLEDLWATDPALNDPPVPRRTGSGGGGPELAAGLPCSDRHLGGPGGPGIHRPRASGVGRRPLPLPCGGEPFRGAHLHRPEMEKRHRRLLVHPLHRPPEPIRPLGRLYRGRGGDFVGRGKQAEPREAGTRKSPENNESSFLPAAAEKASAAALFCRSAGRRAAADVSKKFFELTCQVSRPSFVL